MKLLLIIFCLQGCAFFLQGKEAPSSAKNTVYEINFSNGDWKLKRDKRSDYVFINQKDGRILLSNSFCDEFQEDQLEHLAEKTFKGVSSFASAHGKYTTFRDREAYIIQGTGQVDGVPVNLKLLNTRRDNCYFDFLSISPEGTARSTEAFDDFLKAVKFK